MIPRKGQRWVVRRGKAKRKTVIVITAIYRREPRDWFRELKLKHRYWYEVYYRTEGTWAAHGTRATYLRNFLKIATPHARQAQAPTKRQAPA